MDIQFAFAVPTMDDASRIYSFIRDLAVFEREPAAVVNSPEMILASLKRHPPAFECVFAFIENKAAVGFALFYPTYSTWLGTQGMHLEDLYVAPEMRGTRVGKKLMKFLAGICIERGYQRLEWSVLDWNEDAIRFYQSLGAELFKGWKTFRLNKSKIKELAEPELDE